MDNVYTQIQEFYDTCLFVKGIIKKDLVEKYFRKKAWRGCKEVELKKSWELIENLFFYMNAAKIDSFALLNKNDYLETVFFAVSKDKDFVLSAECIKDFFTEINDFLSYIKMTGNGDYIDNAKMAMEIFFDKEEFNVPDRIDKDGLCSKLSNMDEISLDDANRLNALLENLLNKIGSYYKKVIFAKDFSRAISMYIGPLEDDVQEETDEFWLSFWDYFLFDYHLLRSDQTPLQYFYNEEKDRLNVDEIYILKDLLKAKFTVFSIDSIENGEVVHCTDLFTNEKIELPCPDYALTDYKKMVLYGHLHLSGVMMLNYITSVPASKNLQKRIKEEVLRQYKLYTYQYPKATIDEFFIRHAGAVRHTISILVTFAMVKVVTTESLPSKLLNKEISDEVMQQSEVPVFLEKLTAEYGFSTYAKKVLSMMYRDYCCLNLGKTSRPDNVIAGALFLVFSKINEIDFVEEGYVLHLLKLRPSSFIDENEKIEDILGIKPFDPRYLIEEGFIQALYTTFNTTS